MSNLQFVITNKKKTSFKPFFDVYQAKLKNEQSNNYFVQIYNRTTIENIKFREALEYNECIFSDQFELPTQNIVKIIKKEQNDTFSAHYVQKYDKTLQQFIKDKKKGRFSEENCLMIMEDILKGLATILEAGYRPVSVRADNVVRCFSKNPQERPQIWKIKNVVYTSNLVVEEHNFLVFEQNYSPPQIYGRRNCKDIEYEQSQDYANALLVWSLGIILAKLLGVESKLDSKKKLSEFRGREFNIMDVLYIRNEYSMEFLKLMGSMLHFDSKKRMKLRDVFKQEIFSQDLRRVVSGKPSPSTKSTITMPISNKISSIKKVMDEAIDEVWSVKCSLFEFKQIF